VIVKEEPVVRVILRADPLPRFPHHSRIANRQTATSMTRRIGFVIEQAMGHVSYGMGLRMVLAERDDIDPEWIEVPFEPGNLGRVPLLGRNLTLRGSLRAARAIVEAHRRRSLDALFLHTQTISLFSGPLMARIPTLLSLDATPLNYDELATPYHATVHAAPIERAKLWAHRNVMKHAAAFTTWSEWAKRSLVNDYGASAEKVTVLHPGTVLSSFPHPGARRPRHGRPLNVLFVGGDFPRKGGDLLVDIVRQHFRGRVELHLVTEADVTSSDGVYVHRNLGPLSPELLARFAEADVFVLPTRGDCLAMVLGESMAACLPVITTRVGGHSEAVEDGRSGFLIEKDDASALRDRLDRLERDRTLCFAMGMRARQVGEARFNMQENANRIADILLDLASRCQASSSARPVAVGG
jgi:glycosyltransferase involved in cell wall biosynthesis